MKLQRNEKERRKWPDKSSHQILFHSLFALLLDVVFVLWVLTETTQAGPSEFSQFLKLFHSFLCRQKGNNIYIYKILKSWNWLILAALQRKIKIKILLAKERSLPMSYRGFGPSTRSNLASVGPSSAFGLGSSKYQLQTSSPYDLK